MLDSGGRFRQPDREQRHRDSRGIGEVVDTFAEHSERMRGQPDCDQGRRAEAGSGQERRVVGRFESRPTLSKTASCRAVLTTMAAPAGELIANTWPRARPYVTTARNADNSGRWSFAHEKPGRPWAGPAVGPFMRWFTNGAVSAPSPCVLGACRASRFDHGPRGRAERVLTRSEGTAWLGVGVALRGRKSRRYPARTGRTLDDRVGD